MKLTPELKQITRTRIVEFWGHRHRITPRLVRGKIGDGGQLIWYEPMDTRPDYYLLFVDSRWSMDNCNPDPLCDHLDEIRDAIIDNFGEGFERYDHDNGRTYERYNPFPALSDNCGCQWGKFK